MANAHSNTLLLCSLCYLPLVQLVAGGSWGGEGAALASAAFGLGQAAILLVRTERRLRRTFSDDQL